MTIVYPYDTIDLRGESLHYCPTRIKTMTDRQVATKLADIQKQLLALQKEMLKGGYDEESLGSETVINLADVVNDAIVEFASSGDCVEEFFPE